MKKYILPIVFFFTVASIVIIIVNRNTKRSMQEECLLEFSGKIKNLVKKKDEKNYTIIFEDGSEYKIIFYDLNFLVNVGDSLVKHKNGYTFIIYKPDRLDSAVYVADSRLHKCRTDENLSK